MPDFKSILYRLKYTQGLLVVENLYDVRLLSIKPELANECECWQWEKFVYSDWHGGLLKAQPQLWIYCPEVSVNKIKEDPNKAEECKCWDWIDSEKWSYLLSAQPQFADKCAEYNGQKTEV